MFQTDKQFREILEIGISLTTEKDSNRLLELLLQKAMLVTCCDAGTLFLKEENTLIPNIMQNNSWNKCHGEAKANMGMLPISLAENNVCAYCAIHKQVIPIEDIYDSDEFDFSKFHKQDAQIGYHTKSMLVIPLQNTQGEIIGVLQLMNAQAEEEIISFDATLEFVLLSLASQAAISVSNIKYLQELKELLYSFVSVMATAIDERTPYNGNHTRKVAKYVEEYIHYNNKQWEQGKAKEFFDEKKSELLILSAKLHDIGKIVTPLSIMNKATRLDLQLEKIKERFTLLEAYYKIDYLEHSITEQIYLQENHYLKEAIKLVEDVNNSGVLSEKQSEGIQVLARKQYHNSKDKRISYLTKGEAECLLIQKGTLTEEERKIMENHVTITSKLLSNIHFNEYYKDVPEWAGAHHELLDGSGYPSHLTADEISTEVRILTVADIYDALISSDRPYKEPMPIENAFATLAEMVEDGKLDGDIVAQFIQIPNLGSA